MKKLTIEQKAKAYDEAIKRANSLLSSNELGNAWIYKLLPELAGSEDERMVKFIKNQLFNIKKTITENYELDAKLTNAIDWLEKQGEQKSIDNLTQQKAMDIAVAKCFNEGEQKPAWSEEDKNMLQSILDEYKSMPIEKRNWLKSLRPQSTWKPSEKQILAIETAINVIGKGTLNGGQLTELLEQLKAL